MAGRPRRALDAAGCDRRRRPRAADPGRARPRDRCLPSCGLRRARRRGRGTPRSRRRSPPTGCRRCRCPPGSPSRSRWCGSAMHRALAVMPRLVQWPQSAGVRVSPAKRSNHSPRWTSSASGSACTLPGLSGPRYCSMVRWPEHPRRPATSEGCSRRSPDRKSCPSRATSGPSPPGRACNGAVGEAGSMAQMVVRRLPGAVLGLVTSGACRRADEGSRRRRRLRWNDSRASASRSTTQSASRGSRACRHERLAPYTADTEKPTTASLLATASTPG